MDRESTTQSRFDHLKQFYSLLNTLTEKMGGARTLSGCSGKMQWPLRGVYFLFEYSEIRSDTGTGLRVVRVGTHGLAGGARSKLWNRLYQHRGPTKSGGGNHRGSVFRDLVGRSLIHRDGLDYPHWGKRDHRGSTSPDIRDSERPLEQSVSRTVGAMQVLWLAVEDEPGPNNRRGYLERNAIALLSNYRKPAIDVPSREWLGTYCDKDKVSESGLWNSNHVDDCYDPAFLEMVADLVTEMEESK